MRKFLSIFLIFSLVVPIFSQVADSESQKDEDGLAQVCEAISSRKITKGDFRQLKFIYRLKREMVSSGIFVISSAAIIQTNSKGKKSVISADSNATFDQFSKVLSSVFSGNPESLTQNFDVEFIGTTDNWSINLIPKNASVRKVVSEIEMVGKISIDLMTIHEPNGDYIRYDFITHVYPDALTDEEKALFSEK